MRFFLLLTLCSVLLRATPAQSAGDPAGAPEDPGVMRARLAIDRIRALVDAGALPRLQLEQAEANLADAKDMAVLRTTMASKDLTEEQSAGMVAAAARHLERREKDLERTRSLLASGIAARNDLKPFEEQVDFARQEYDLAVSRAQLSHELAEMARAEQARQSERPAQVAGSDPVHFDGKGVFTPAQFEKVSAAYQQHFAKALPISAMGETAAHRALGFDHRGRVDVAVNPDQPEGVWLRQYLEAHAIPYFAFWHAAAGKATGAHIHIGPESTRLTAVAD